MLINDDAEPEPKQQQDLSFLILIDDQCLFNLTKVSFGGFFNKWQEFYIYLRNLSLPL